MSTFQKLDSQPLDKRALQPEQAQKKASIRNLPVNLFASVMGIAGTSIVWRQAGQEFGASPLIANGVGFLAIALFILLGLGYLLKAVRHTDAVIAEYKNPVSGNFFGTIAIAILLLSAVIAPLSQPIAEVIWTLGTIATLALCFAIVSRLLKGKIEVAHAVPAWFIPGVATLDIAVAGGTMPMSWAHEINLFSLAVGTMIALLFFTMIMSRIIHQEPLPAAMTPSLLILIAPFAVGFLAYTNFMQKIDNFAGVLFYFALFMFLVLAPKVFRKGIPFASSWWAISFPLAALTSAALKYALFVQSQPLKFLAILLLAGLSMAIVILLVKTLQFLFNGKLLAN